MYSVYTALVYTGDVISDVILVGPQSVSELASVSTHVYTASGLQRCLDTGSCASSGTRSVTSKVGCQPVNILTVNNLPNCHTFDDLIKLNL